MFLFQNKCAPNCTSVHINGFWLVNAIKTIEVGSVLSVDLIAGVDGLKRKETLAIQFEQSCECEICNGAELHGSSFTTIEQLYDQIEILECAKKKKQYIWGIIKNEWEDRFNLFEGDFMHLIYYFIYYVQKEC